MKKFVVTVSLILCLFTVCSVAVTYAGIRKVKQEREENSLQVTMPTEAPTEVPVTSTPSPTPAPAEQGIDLYGTYDENDLLIRTQLAFREDDVEIKIPQLDGLKNTEIQEKINQDIFNRIGNLLREYPLAGYGEYYVRGNFANVISICFYTGDGERYDQVYLNYNLATGEQLNLEDLFLKDADITQCVRSAFYDMLALRNTYDMEGNFNEMVSPDENELYKLVKCYMNSEEQEFSFTPAEILFYYEDHVATLSMLEIAEQIAVYSRFLTEESLFVRDDIGYDNIFTCADTQYEPFHKIEYGYSEPNFWYDITIWESYLEDDFTGEKREQFMAAEEAFYVSVEKKIEEYKEVAKSNPDKFYILLLKPNAYLLNLSGKYSNVAEFNNRYDLYEMPMEVYETTYRDKLIAAYRYTYFAMAGGAFLEWEEGDGANRQMVEHSMTYNYVAGKELTELEEVFRKGSGYMDVIRSQTWDALSWRGEHSWGEISAMVDTLECRLAGTGVYVTIPSLDDFYLYIFFGEFDESMLKIFD